MADVGKRKLPVGIQTFRRIREEGFYYVDKTGYAYLIEVKVAERSEPGAALAQLRERRYADKHRAPGRAVHLIGVEISAASRSITAFRAEPA